MTRLTDMRLEEIVKGNGGFLELAIMARELLLFRKELRASLKVERMLEHSRQHRTTDAMNAYAQAASEYREARKSREDFTGSEV